jgi:L-alanine-DL-glutamate epimerase-like enolase superfamily enzyme
MRNLTIRTESWPLKTPLRITGRSFDTAEVLVVELEEGGCVGRAEAAGVFYLGETVASLSQEISNIRQAVESGLTRAELQLAMPAGGTRNALDCALWDLKSKQRGVRVWNLIGADVAPVYTVNTIGVGSPEEMAAAAATIDSPHIKIKLDAEAPVERVEAIRKARPDAELVIDVNQGWTFEILRDVAPHMQRLNVRMIEQPLPRGGDSILEGYRAPIPICADESCLHRGELADAARRYQMINIKLDKTGGLTEALALAHEANRCGLKLMVGNMLGTSLAMAPAFVVAQRCRFVDLDGPTLLSADRDHAMSYAGGRVSVPEAPLWG